MKKTIRKKGQTSEKGSKDGGKEILETYRKKRKRENYNKGRK